MESWSALNSEAAADGQLFEGMTWATRIQGYVLFTVLGMFASFMGWVAISTGYLWKYSVLTTLGQTMSLFSTIFLMGPQKQIANMFDPTRRSATLLYLATMVLTLVVAVTFKSPFLCILCGILQFAALVWYSLSYVPYGREMVKGLFGGCSRVVMNA